MTTCCSCGVSVLSRRGPREGRTPSRPAQSGCRAWNLSSARVFLGEKEMLNSNLSSAQLFRRAL
jgi:hypothetical protein